MARDTTVATWGNIMCDLIFTGLPGLPVMGEELFARRLTIGVGGGSALSALGLRRLGWTVTCIGRVGRDPLGELAVGLLEAGDVDTSHLIRFGGPGEPGNVTVAMSYPSDRAFITHQPSGPWPTDGIPLGGFRHHHFAGYEGREDIIRQLAAGPGTVSLDTGWGEHPDWGEQVQQLLPAVDLFLPNLHEARHLTGTSDPGDALEALSGLCPLVVIKLGPAGALARLGDETVHHPGFRVEPLDTTGAGDAFDAGFIDGWLRGWSLARCLVRGNACGALAASRAGGHLAFADAAEVEDFVAEGGA